MNYFKLCLVFYMKRHNALLNLEWLEVRHILSKRGGFNLRKFNMPVLHFKTDVFSLSIRPSRPLFRSTDLEIQQEVPEGVVGVITPDAPDVLAHVGEWRLSYEDAKSPESVQIRFQPIN